MYTFGFCRWRLILASSATKIFLTNISIPLDSTLVSANLHQKFAKRFGKCHHIALVDSGSIMIHLERLLWTKCQKVLAIPSDGRFSCGSR